MILLVLFQSCIDKLWMFPAQVDIGKIQTDIHALDKHTRTSEMWLVAQTSHACAAVNYCHEVLREDRAWVPLGVDQW